MFFSIFSLVFKPVVKGVDVEMLDCIAPDAKKIESYSSIDMIPFKDGYLLAIGTSTGTVRWEDN